MKLAMRVVVAFAAFAMLFSGTAHAQESCTSVNSGDFLSGATWSCVGAPTGTPGVPDTVSDSASIVAPHTVTVSADAIAGSVSTAPASAVSINASVFLSTQTYSQSGDLLGAGTLNLTNGISQWVGGTMGSAGGITFIGFLGTLNIFPGAGKTLNNHQINVVNNNSILNIGDDFTMDGGALIGNTGFVQLTSDFTLVDGGAGGGSIFNNGGVFQKTAGTGTSTIGVPYTSTGNTFSFTGSLAFTGGGSISGNANPNGGNIVLGGGTFTWNVGTANGASFTIVDGGTLDIPGTSNFEKFKLISGELTGSGAAQIYGPFIWSGGLMSGTGTTSSQIVFCCVPGPTFSLEGTTKTLIARRLQFFSGFGSWSAGDIAMQDGAVIDNRSNLQITGNDSITHISGAATSFRQIGGTLTKISTGITTLEVGAELFNQGIIDISAGTLLLNGTYTPFFGSLQLSGGTVQSPNLLNLPSGSLVGVGTVDADVSSDSSTYPGGLSTVGTLTITGDFAQGPNAFLAIDVQGPPSTCTTADSLIVAGTASLAGQLSTIRTCVPDGSELFTILQAAAVTGTFAREDISGFDAIYNPTNVQLDGLPPAPDYFVDILSTSPINEGDQLFLDIAFGNNGTANATSNATLTIDLPAGSNVNPGDFYFATGGTLCVLGTPTQVVCTGPMMSSGETGFVQVYFIPPAGNVTTTATIAQDPSGDQNPANNSDSEMTAVQPALNLTVTTGNDEVDAVRGNGICMTATGECSLRAAIDESNLSSTQDTITLGNRIHTLSIPGINEDLNQTGDLDILDRVIISGLSPQFSIIDGGGIDRVFDLFSSSGEVDLNLVTVRNGNAPAGEAGGGLRVNTSSELNLSYAEVANNFAPTGGGIFVDSYSGDARREPGDPDRSRRKPTDDTFCCTSDIQILNSAILNNNAQTGTGGGLLVNSGSVLVMNSTVGFNNAAVSGGGMAITTPFSASLTTEYTTISDNTAPSGAGVFAASSANPNFSHTIIANHLTGDCATSGGSFNSSGYNINEDGSCGFINIGDQTGDPKLAPLTNLGATTSYFGLLEGSSAIDAGNPGSPLTIDQRGQPRPRDGDSNGSFIVDIGGVETQPEAQLSLTKNGPATVIAGGSITYTIGVGNFGPNDADPVTVTDSISVGTFVSATAPCTGGFPCNVGPLPVGQVVIFDATFSIPGTATGSVTNTASVSSPATDFDPTNNSSSRVSTIIASADLSVSKTGPSFVTAGQTVTYATTFNNGGPSVATNVIVSDPTPAGLTFLSNTGACSGPFPCNVGTVTAGGGATITSMYLVAPSATGTITNTATATSDASDPNTANNSGTIVSSVSASGDLSIVKNGPTSVLAGQNIMYTIDVLNPGPSNATGVMVSDPTPAGTTFVSNTGACNTAFPCNIGTLTPGQTASVTATYSVSGTASGSITNTATVSSTSGDSNTANNNSSTTATVVSQADVSITKTGPAMAQSGDTVAYTVTVFNSGPSPAANITINDPTPAGLTFVSNSGGCTSAYPCSGGSLAAGQSKTITSTYTVNSGASGAITNTASVTTTTNETSTTNNSSSATTSVGGCPQAAPATQLPADGAQNVPLNGSLNWSNTGATSYNLYFGPALSGCSTLIFSGSATSQQYFNLTPGQEYEYRVEGVQSGCTTLSSACARFRAAAPAVTCPAPPSLISPTSGTISSPVTFRFTAVEGATLYTLTINGQQAGTTTDTQFTTDIPNGQLTWSVTATVPGCPPLISESATLNICNVPSAPIPSLVGEAATGQSYRMQWTTVPDAIRYELQESLDAEFDSVNDTFVVTGNFRDFEKNIPNPPVGFYYRVRAIGACGEVPGPYSEIVRIVIVPIPANPNVSIPAGSTEVVLQTIFVPGDPGITSQFTATTDQLWLTVRPSSGLLPPDGITLNIVADPSTLSNGTFTGTIILELTDVTTLRRAGKLSPDQATGGKKKQIPVSISLVTPITPQQRTTPVNDSLIIPSVGHLDGINSRFQSDVRVTNTSLNRLRYQISFNQAGQDPGRPIKQTFVDVEGNGTIALDDIVKNFFGIGGLGDQAAGFIEIRPFGSSGALSPEVDQAGIPRASRVTVASSRTYNVSSNGTLGQFIPALSFSGFISRAGGPLAGALSLQQISQNSAFRSNIGLVEASGLPVSVLMSIFNTAGNKLLEIPVDLKGGELRQFNALLAQNGITLADGRVEVRVLSGDGRVTAYASVIENATNDPLLVSGITLGQTRSQRFVFPGAGSLTSAAARFRTDMRIFNSGATQTATLTFYPQSGPTVSRQLTLNSGEVRVLDDVVGALFGVQGAGAVHVQTPTDAELIVSGRTYADTARGQFGQFIEAVTPDEAVGRSDRTLHILQVEDSPRYRTNIGVAEVTGKPATVEVLVFLPDSKVVPRVVIPMKANEFRQFQLLKELGLGNVYNARVSVRVMDGDGRVTAYGSVVDETSQDPTYIKAQ